MDIENYSKYKKFYYGDGIPDLLAKYINKTKVETILDLGCGDGLLLRALDNLGYLKSKKVYAIDLSQERVNLVQEINKEFKCFAEDACSATSIKDGSIDFLMATQLIEHVQDDDKMVKEISRMLAENGTVYLSTNLKKWYGWYFYRNNGKWVLDPTHIREYSNERQLLDILDKYNFKVIESKKTQTRRALRDFFLKRMGANVYAYKNRFLNRLPILGVPVLGYYEWELVFTKNKI